MPCHTSEEFIISKYINTVNNLNKTVNSHVHGQLKDSFGILLGDHNHGHNPNPALFFHTESIK